MRSANIHELHASGAVTLESGATIPQVDTVMYCTGAHLAFHHLWFVFLALVLAG